MIISFRHKGLEAFYKTGSTKGIQAKHASKLSYVLDTLNRAKKPESLDFPSFKLHQLKGDLKGY